jgi:outer membrane lipoprotein-sorting protein
MIDDQRKVMIRPARIAFVGIVLLVGQCRCACQAVPALSGEHVLENVEKPFAGIEDYTVTLDVSADLERLQVPEMQATMYFKQPDKVHFETDGFALLPREGMALTLGRLRSKYAVESTKEQMLDGSKVVLLRLRPRGESLRLQELLLYVDPVRWTVVRGILGLPGGRAMTITFEYERVEDRWLPSKMTALFSAAPIDTASMNFFEQIAPTRRPQLPRNGTVTVRYSNYRVNTGLSDDIFERAAKDDRD